MQSNSSLRNVIGLLMVGAQKVVGDQSKADFVAKHLVGTLGDYREYFRAYGRSKLCDGDVWASRLIQRSKQGDRELDLSTSAKIHQNARCFAQLSTIQWKRVMQHQIIVLSA